MCHIWFGPAVLYCRLCNRCLGRASTPTRSSIFNSSLTISLSVDITWTCNSFWVICLYPIVLPLPLNSCSIASQTAWGSERLLLLPRPVCFDPAFFSVVVDSKRSHAKMSRAAISPCNRSPSENSFQPSLLVHCCHYTRLVYRWVRLQHNYT